MPMMRIITWLLILTGCCLYAKGQDPYYLSINTTNGLLSNSVYQVFQDDKGYIWIAHEQGLSRFDGQQFNTYTGSKQSYKAGTNIKQDKQGRIWYETFDGYVYYIENDTMKWLNTQNKSVAFIPYGMVDDHIIVISNNNAEFFDLNNLRHTRSLELGQDMISTTFVVDNKFFVAFGNLLYELDAQGIVKTTQTPEGSAVFHNKGKHFLINRSEFDGWVYERENDITKAKFYLPDVKFTQGIMYVGGKYWICTPDGVWIFSEEGEMLNGGKPMFKGKNISGVFEDKEGNYWFCTLNEGILFVPDVNAIVNQINNSIPLRFAAGMDKLYVATNKNEVFSFDPQSGAVRLLYKDDVPHQVNELVIDYVNENFLVSAQFLKVFDKKMSLVVKNDKPVKSAVVLDEKYYAYTASGAAGLMLINNSVNSDWDELYQSGSNSSTESVLLTGNRFRCVAFNGSSGLYFSGSRGLYKFSKKQKKVKEIKLNNEQIFISNMTTYNGQLVVVTTDNTLLLFDERDNVLTTMRQDGLQLYSAHVIDGVLFVLTSSGVKQYNNNTKRLETSGLLNGIRSEEVHDIQLYNNQLFVATDKGVISMPRATAEERIPPLYLTEVSVNGVRRAEMSQLSLGYTENNIEIFYAAPSFRNPGRFPVMYKINDGKWLYAGGAHSLKLASLSPGDYNITFAQDAGGGKPAHEASVFLSIATPFWRTAWFWALAMILCGSLVYSYYRWQTGLLKKQNQLLTEKVTLERNLHKSVLTSIRSQMNPHFFYNALNTIQSYIVNDEKRNASAYLSKFSRLTRTILEMTGKETVTLAEEINALKLYLDLEKVRFNNELNCTINVVKGLDTDEVRIPSMIVQPYIENSIKHGLLHKAGEKILLVDFLKKEQNLCIVIDDNGIGRKKSMELNKIRADKHKPFATEANLKRIEILNQGNNNIGVVYTDKTDAFGQSNGTIVTITIPLMKQTS